MVFNVGDVVILKSSGNEMTVATLPEKKSILEYGQDVVVCYCVWHDDEGRPQSLYYPVDVLEPIATL